MLTKIDPKTIQDNVFSTIGSDWLLITAGTKERCNTMTASWGGLGVLWGRNVATVYIRPQRYTYDFVEQSDCFTISVFDESWRDALNLCGTKSGRDVDKIKECGFTVVEGEGGAPYFEQARLVLVCRKLYWQDMDPDHFLDPEIDSRFYAQKDYHRVYVGEIVEAYKRG